MSNSRRVFLGAGLLLAGCGQVVPAGTPEQAFSGPGGVLVAPTPPPPANREIAREMAAKGLAAFSRLKTFRAQAYSTDNDPRTHETFRSAVDVQYKAPSRFRLQVLPGFDNAGLKLSFVDGSNKIAVRPGGVLGFAKLQLGTDDSRTKTSHGFPFMAITIKGTLGRLADPRAIVGYSGDSLLDGRTCHVLSVTGPALLPTVTEERVFFDKATFLPARAEERIGSQIVFSSTVRNLRPNAPVSDDSFNI